MSQQPSNSTDAGGFSRTVKCSRASFVTQHSHWKLGKQNEKEQTKQTKQDATSSGVRGITDQHHSTDIHDCFGIGTRLCVVSSAILDARL
jgi:hypothetical protein